jgi:AraC family transcriptional regulator
MQPSPRGASPPQDQLNPNGSQRAEHASSPERPEPWTVVRQLCTQGARYVESRHAAFASHPAHVHTAPTIALLLRGALEVRFASGRRLAADEAAAGSALVLPPGPPHRGRVGADGAQVLYVMPDADRLATMGSTASEVLADPAWWRGSGIAMLGRGLVRELAVADDAAALALEGLTLELLAILVRRRRESALPGSPPAWLRRVREALHDRHPERELRIAELATVAGVDPAHLARAFRRHYGMTAGTYLREIRVQRAADVLARSSAPLAQIALDAGFADQSHFTRVFRTAYGVTPQRWRALKAVDPLMASASNG